VLGAALADELENVDRDLVVRGTREHAHRREISRHRSGNRSARAKHQRKQNAKAKARTHADIVRRAFHVSELL
jgi:hypothetical protein